MFVSNDCKVIAPYLPEVYHNDIKEYLSKDVICIYPFITLCNVKFTYLAPVIIVKSCCIHIISFNSKFEKTVKTIKVQTISYCSPIDFASMSCNIGFDAFNLRVKKCTGNGTFKYKTSELANCLVNINYYWHSMLSIAPQDENLRLLTQHNIHTHYPTAIMINNLINPQCFYVYLIESNKFIAFKFDHDYNRYRHICYVNVKIELVGADNSLLYRAIKPKKLYYYNPTMDQVTEINKEI